MNRVSAKVFVTLLLAMSASSLHLVGIDENFQNDEIVFEEEPASDDEITFIRGEISDIFPSDEVDKVDEMVEEEFDVENKTTENEEMNKKSGILKIRSHANDITEFNKAVERELTRKDFLIKRYQEQSRKMEKIQAEIRRQNEKYNPRKIFNSRPIEEEKPKEHSFWEVICGIARTLVGGFLTFFGIKI
jgi:hypothetical protein